MSLTLALSLVVRLYDTAGLSHADAAHAQSTAAAILSPAGIALEWRDCKRAGCENPVTPAELVLRIVGSAEGSHPASLGYTFVTAGDDLGALLTVIAGRVRDLAKAAGVDTGTLIGRAMAHEIGHALLGTPEHSGAGLMRPTWKESELRHTKAADWEFSSAEAERMRARLSRRCTPCVPPAHS